MKPDPDAVSNDQPGSSPKGKLLGDDVIFRIMPAIVQEQIVNFNIQMENPSSFNWMLIDVMGNVYQKGRTSGDQQYMNVDMSVEGLSPGVYTIVTDLYGQAGRFVKN